MRPTIASTIAAAMLVGGCGLGWLDDPSGGSDNLPTQGAGPYGKPEVDFDTPADEPNVLADRQAQLLEPDALARDDGGFRLWYGRHPARDQAAIWYAELPSITDLPDREPALAIEATADWEAGRITAPSVVDLGGGHLALFYEGGPETPADGGPVSAGRAIGRADSTDGGASWTKSDGNPVLTGARAPAAAFVDDTWTLLVVRDTPGDPAGDSAIWRAVATDGGAFTLDDSPAVAPRPGLAEAFDALAVDSPDIVVEETPAGQRHWSLFFSGTHLDGGLPVVGVGYAGSFEGVSWQRFGGPDAVLSDVLSETGPAVLLFASRGVMFFSENRQAQSRIAVAVHP